MLVVLIATNRRNPDETIGRIVDYTVYIHVLQYPHNTLITPPPPPPLRTGTYTIQAIVIQECPRSGTLLLLHRFQYNTCTLSILLCNWNLTKAQFKGQGILSRAKYEYNKQGRKCNLPDVKEEKIKTFLSIYP